MTKKFFRMFSKPQKLIRKYLKVLLIVKSRIVRINKNNAASKDAALFFIHFFERAFAVMNAVIGIERITPILLEIPLITSIER